MPEPLTVYTISPSPDSAVAVELKQSGLRKRTLLFAFERYSGELLYCPERPLESTLQLHIDVSSIADLKVRKILAADSHPEIAIVSRRFTAKPLRGFVAEGTLRFRGLDHALKANVGFGPLKNGRVHIDADSTLRLSQLAIARQSSFFGLIHTDDEIMLHASLWGVGSVSSFI